MMGKLLEHANIEKNGSACQKLKAHSKKCKELEKLLSLKGLDETEDNMYISKNATTIWSFQ